MLPLAPEAVPCLDTVRKLQRSFVEMCGYLTPSPTPCLALPLLLARLANSIVKFVDTSKVVTVWTAHLCL